MINKFKQFLKEVDEYYPLYLQQHQNKWNRRLHYFGQLFTLVWFITCLYLIYNLYLIAIIPLFLTLSVVYPFAWFGHLFLEKNKPATWKVDWKITKICDLKMFLQMLTGKIKF